MQIRINPLQSHPITVILFTPIIAATQTKDAVLQARQATMQTDMVQAYVDAAHAHHVM